VNFHRYAIADVELVHPGTELDDGAHVFMTGREILVERRAALDQRGRTAVDDFEVGRAHRDRIDAHEHFGGAGLRHRFIDELQFIGVAEHPGLHAGGDGKTFRRARVCHQFLLSRCASPAPG